MLAGASITLYSVSLHDSGVYVCTASNDDNTPVSSKIIVSIGHSHGMLDNNNTQGYKYNYYRLSTGTGVEEIFW